MPKISKPGVKPFWESGDGRAVVWLGDCREVMRLLAAETFDTILTDPPYDLTSKIATVRSAFPGRYAGTVGAKRGFMGKTWDGTGVAFDPATWAEVLRVAKPGASLLSFGGTRTWHRLACAIEDAGWEIRDQLIRFWCYGSGFPKSLDISKSIDAIACRADLTERLGRPPTWDEFKAAWATWREVVGCKVESGPDFSDAQFVEQGSMMQTHHTAPRIKINVHAPATDAAKEWNGWGTALKPAWEPIVVAMKPLDGTFAQNAVKHGVAGLNIDGARIATDELKSGPRVRNAGTVFGDDTCGLQGEYEYDGSKGRWPANVVLDEGAAELLDRMSGETSGKTILTKRSATKDIDGAQYHGGYSGQDQVVIGYPDAGGASRFFYTAKADSGERHAAGRNHHPTVKPLDLMVWLARLTATPTGGVVLDPFMGSGTTGVACLQVGRCFVGIEQDPESCEVAVKRLQKACAYRFHGTKFARRLNAKINKKLKGK